MSCSTILMADDDSDDRFFVEQAVLHLGTCADPHFVEDGQELVNYLRRLRKYADPLLSLRPSLILLDLNMPTKEGRQALVEIKAHPDLREIPIAVWTTSDEKQDRIYCQKAGADVYVTKQQAIPNW